MSALSWVLFMSGLSCLLQASSDISNVKKSAFVSFQVARSVAPASTCSDAIPAGAVTYGYNTCTFASVFNQTRIDINNSGGAATTNTDWWVSNPYQNFVVSPANWDFSGATTVLNKGAGDTDSDNSPSLSSVYCPYSFTCYGAGFTKGRTFKNGVYVRYTFAFDETLANSNHITFPSFWGANWISAAAGFEYIEQDTLDAKPSTGSVLKSPFYHNWNAPGQATDVNTEFMIQSTSLVLDGATFNTVDWLWVPTTKNSGTGLIQTIYNGANISGYGLSYTQSGMASPGSGGITANYNGAFYNAEVNDVGFMLFITAGKLSGGGNWPLKLKNVQVWQGSSSDIVVR